MKKAHLKQLFSFCLLLLMTQISIADVADPTDSLVPEYARKHKPACDCSCDDRIIYSQAPVNASTLTQWSKEAAVAPFTFGFGNYKQALASASQYFTLNGWREFREAMNSSGNLRVVLEKGLIVSATVSGEPIIKTAESMDKNQWTVQLPITVKYESSERTVKQMLVVTMTVVQSPLEEDVQGLGVQHYVVEHTPG